MALHVQETTNADVAGLAKTMTLDRAPTEEAYLSLINHP
jgi:hypothetical protein